MNATIESTSLLLGLGDHLVVGAAVTLTSNMAPSFHVVFRKDALDGSEGFLALVTGQLGSSGQDPDVLMRHVAEVFLTAAVDDGVVPVIRVQHVVVRSFTRVIFILSRLVQLSGFLSGLLGFSGLQGLWRSLSNIQLPFLPSAFSCILYVVSLDTFTGESALPTFQIIFRL